MTVQDFAKLGWHGRVIAVASQAADSAVANPKAAIRRGADWPCSNVDVSDCARPNPPPTSPRLPADVRCILGLEGTTEPFAYMICGAVHAIPVLSQPGSGTPIGGLGDPHEQRECPADVRSR